MNEQGFAKAIRIITLPQIMVFFLILLLGDRLPPGHDIVAMVMLCALPLLSYLCWRVSPRLREQGRRSQRKLAICFSVAGYLLGTVYCLASGGSQTELFMYLSYVICGVLIALSSFVFHIKSSEHAAGVVEPVMILTLRVSARNAFNTQRLPVIRAGKALSVSDMIGVKVALWVRKGLQNRHDDAAVHDKCRTHAVRHSRDRFCKCLAAALFEVRYRFPARNRRQAHRVHPCLIGGV